VSGLLFSLGSFVVGALPRALVYRGASGLGSLAFTFRPALRRQAIENYAPVLRLPDGDPEVRRVARAAVIGYAQLIADFLLMPRLGRARLLDMIEPVGLDRLREVVDAGKGAIVVTPHFGNWDLAAAAAAASGFKVTVVTEKFGPEGMNRKVVAARGRLGLKVVPLSIAAGKASVNALRRGEVVGLVCDLPKDGRNVAVNLVGQRAMVPAGPALLSLRSGAPVVPITCLRVADGKYRLDVQAPLSRPREEASEADVTAYAQAIVDRFEAPLRAHPEQWYLFSPMWGRVGAAEEVSAGASPEPAVIGGGMR